MDAMASKSDGAITNGFNLFKQLHDYNHYKPPKHNTVTKYTKLPDFDFDSAQWCSHRNKLEPRLRCLIQLDVDNLLLTSRSFKNRMPSQNIKARKSTKAVMLTISEEHVNGPHQTVLKDKKQYRVKSTTNAVELDTNKPSNNSSSNPSSISTSPNSISSTLSIPISQWSSHGNILEPEFRSITRLDDDNLQKTNKSSFKDRVLQHNIMIPSKSTKRVMVTITEESENDLHQKCSQDKKQYTFKSTNKPIEVDIQKQSSNKVPYSPSSRFSNNPSSKFSSPKLSREIRSAKTSKTYYEKELTVAQQNYKDIRPRSTISTGEKSKIEIVKEKETLRRSRGLNATSKTKASNNFVTPIQKEMSKVQNIVTNNNMKIYSATYKRLVDKSKLNKLPLLKNKLPKETIKEDLNKRRALTIHVPLTNTIKKDKHVSNVPVVQSVKRTVDTATETNGVVHYKDAVVATDPVTTLVSQITDIQDFKINAIKTCESAIQTESLNILFDSLEIPNVTLTKDKSEPKEDLTIFNTTALANFEVPLEKIAPQPEEASSCDSSICESASYIISQATRQKLSVTYTTRQKFNFKLLGKGDDVGPPELMKPSDIISSIRVNSGILQSDICEQFQRELNFIDSFFESLQYLHYSWHQNVKNSEHDNFLSKLEDGANIDDTETMASKSLCLLNLLIRDEQRRAKNLLFVLKMREEALKDFTKSQILWLEKKKKHDNTDISTLKKKQRGALLKLQHECGEMQRMRKALLTLSEKRKVALMKTMKNIEMKLKNNVDVEQIILGKKKLKRSTCFDRNAAPLKCFDLSSSGCEESPTAKTTSDAPVLLAEECTAQCEVGETRSVISVEKCVQTNSSYCGDAATDTAAENFVVVDGGYLNILFHNLTLPQIFSSGKQYEVNEEALKNIVNSANSHNTNLSGSEVVEKLLDKIKNKDGDTSSTSPSTARSLIDEFDQYYKDLTEIDKSRPTTPESLAIKDSNSQTGDFEYERPVERLTNTSVMTTSSINDNLTNQGELCVCTAAAPLESERIIDKEPATTSQAPTGPLPVPVGAAAVVDSQPSDVVSWLLSKAIPTSSLEAGSVSSQSLCVSTSSTTSVAAPPVSTAPLVSAVPLVSASAHVEAEELRRQQLAIEREIKALEQQQCRLLVVREIPDKPPPPYTPPIESRSPKPTCMFSPDENLEEKVAKHITDPEGSNCELAEPYMSFVQDYCQESQERHKQEQSDMPWDACNLLPQKPQVEINELIEKTSSELKDVLTCWGPPTVSGVSSRRSDHIDDILFAEWRRCEPEWTALHADEAIVKNQMFETIFQKILTDTIDEYKRTVQCNVVTSDKIFIT